MRSCHRDFVVIAAVIVCYCDPSSPARHCCNATISQLLLKTSETIRLRVRQYKGRHWPSWGVDSRECWLLSSHPSGAGRCSSIRLPRLAIPPISGTQPMAASRSRPFVALGYATTVKSRSLVTLSGSGATDRSVRRRCRSRRTESQLDFLSLKDDCCQQDTVADQPPRAVAEQSTTAWGRTMRRTARIRCLAAGN